MDLIQVVNHYWPNTIARLAIDSKHLPSGIPFMGAFVEMFDGATLPSEDEVMAKISEYEEYLSVQSNNTELLKQISILESSVTERMRQEVLSGSTEVINNSSSPYNGMTATQTIKAIVQEKASLREKLK